jgi:hypothetical protein
LLRLHALILGKLRLLFGLNALVANGCSTLLL